MDAVPTHLSTDPSVVPQPDEVQALFVGLDAVAATVALLLADAGVCSLNLHDPSPVTQRDVHVGPYPLTLAGVPREYALRRMLLGRWARSVPVSAPELFCSSAVPTAVVLRSAWVAGTQPEDLALQSLAAPVDPQLPTCMVVSHGPFSLPWPIMPWYRRPCRDSLPAAVRFGRQRLRQATPPGTSGSDVEHSAAPTALTRMSTASEIAVSLLDHALNHGAWVGAGAGSSSEGDDPDLGSGAVTLRYGLHRAELRVRTDCLCAMDV